MNILSLIKSFFTGDKANGAFRTVGTFKDTEKSIGIGKSTATGEVVSDSLWIPPKKCYHNRNGYKPMTDEVVAIIALDRKNYKVKPCKRCGTIRYKKIQKSPWDVLIPGLYHCKAIALEDIRPNSYCILRRSLKDGKCYIRMACVNDTPSIKEILTYSEFGANKGQVMVNKPGEKGDAVFEVKL